MFSLQGLICLVGMSNLLNFDQMKFTKLLLDENVITYTSMLFGFLQPVS